MIAYYNPSIVDCDFAQEIAAHSGDETIVYKNVALEPLYISLYFPNTQTSYKGGYPILLFVHGGGWQSKKVFPGQTSWAGDHLGFLARYYANRGYLCASIDYRLMNRSGHEQDAELIDLYADCMDAAEYVRNRANEWNADAHRIFVLGESAGSYLAAAMATLPLRQREIFSGAILVNAITDLTDEHWGQSISCDSKHPLLAGKSAADKIELLSPCANICPELPPVLLLHGSRDSCVAPVHSMRFYEKSRSFGNDVELDWIMDTEHAFLLAEYMYEKGRGLGAACTAVHCIDAWLARQCLQCE